MRTAHNLTGGGSQMIIVCLPENRPSNARSGNGKTNASKRSGGGVCCQPHGLLCILHNAKKRLDDLKTRIWQIVLFSREGHYARQLYTLSVVQMELCHERTKGSLAPGSLYHYFICSSLLPTSFVCCKNCRHAWNSTQYIVGEEQMSRGGARGN